MNSNNRKIRLKCNFEGIVQGVGFRPAMFRLANLHGLGGTVSNSPQGVELHIEGDVIQIERFRENLYSSLPPNSVLEKVTWREVAPVGEILFRILASQHSGERNTRISPEINLCNECLSDLHDHSNRRFQYPFINCTNCGPRYSIIYDLPYDRCNTTMKSFQMCEECENEYNDPTTRWYHAQPIACPNCGPKIMLLDRVNVLANDNSRVLELARKNLAEGKILAVKGIGGFQLMVRSDNPEAVQLLRERKYRESKPFAVMFPNENRLLEVCDATPLELARLKGKAAPIVLIKRKECRASYRLVCDLVANNNPYIGAMLPNTPLHHLLLKDLPFPVVCTSGNHSGEPICIDNENVIDRLGDIADIFLVHNREIVRPVDDSVVQVIDGEIQTLRLARGFAPFVMNLEYDNQHNHKLLAVGGHFKNSVSVYSSNRLTISQYIGDMDELLTTELFQSCIKSMQNLTDISPDSVVSDMHSRYYSTNYAETHWGNVQKVQHHLAHILSCMLENGIQTDVLGVAFDGTGVGTDGTIWGGEFLALSNNQWKRVGHLKPFKLPGGDSASRDGRRSAFGLLHEIMGEELLLQNKILEDLEISNTEANVWHKMVEVELNSFNTSSAGRFFDAVAAILEISNNSSFEGESAMKLEFTALKADLGGQCATSSVYLKNNLSSNCIEIDWAPYIMDLLINKGKVDKKRLAYEFHQYLADGIVTMAEKFAFKQVVLSGGCFQNRLLVSLVKKKLMEKEFIPVVHSKIPPNDGGISAGQIYAALLNIKSV